MAFTQKGSSWYQVDPNTGELIYSATKPTDMTNVLTREVETGEYVDDPNSKETYYTIGGEYSKDVSGKGWRMDSDARRRKREAVNYILSHPEIYGVESRRDLRNDETQERLANMEYSTKMQALRANNFLNPALTKKRVDWNWVETPLAGTKITRGGCKTCGKWSAKQDAILGNIWHLDRDVYKTTSTVGIDENERYTAQMPVMRTEYAAPFEGREEIVTETQQIPVAASSQTTPKTTTKSTSKTYRSSGSGPRIGSGRTVKTGTSIKSTTPATSATSSSFGTVTRQKKVLYDPDGNVVGTEYLKNGGNLNYFNYL